LWVVAACRGKSAAPQQPPKRRKSMLCTPGVWQSNHALRTLGLGLSGQRSEANPKTKPLTNSKELSGSLERSACETGHEFRSGWAKSLGYRATSNMRKKKPDHNLADLVKKKKVFRLRCRPQKERGEVCFANPLSDPEGRCNLGKSEGRGKVYHEILARSL